MNVADELEKLDRLHTTGVISDEDFEAAKRRLLSPPTNPFSGMSFGATIEQQTRTWATILHISQLASCVAPGVGLILPFVIWQVKKAELPEIDEHGKIVANWIISEIIYMTVSFLLFFVIIGIPMLIAVALLGLIFPIIGCVKANNGEVWRYPMSIPFFR